MLVYFVGGKLAFFTPTKDVLHSTFSFCKLHPPHFDPLSVVQTNSSLLVSPLTWSFTLPQFSFLLSSRVHGIQNGVMTATKRFIALLWSLGCHRAETSFPPLHHSRDEQPVVLRKARLLTTKTAGLSEC